MSNISKVAVLEAVSKMESLDCFGKDWANRFGGTAIAITYEVTGKYNCREVLNTIDSLVESGDLKAGFSRTDSLFWVEV